MGGAKGIHGHHLEMRVRGEGIKLAFNVDLRRYILATIFVVVNLVGQLSGVAMILFRKKVAIACGLLFCIVLLQVND